MGIKIMTNTQPRKKICKCNMCGRQMEVRHWENAPYYCWKCSDKHEIGRETEQG